MMHLPIPEDFLRVVDASFRREKELGEKAMAQMDEADLFRPLVPDGNSVAILVQHLAGNMRSRWTDLFTTDGEKADRDRDAEFLPELESREAVMGRWQVGWLCLFEGIRSLRAEDLTRTVKIRGEPHTVVQAVVRQLVHHAYHVGQIVQLARHYAGDDWTSLSIPRGQSGQYLRVPPPA